jgi:hypothetical protein
MVLLVYHFDKNNAASQQFSNEEARLELGFYPKKNTRVKLRTLGFNVNSLGGACHLSFPDINVYDMEIEEIDATDTWELQGLHFVTEQGIKRTPYGGGRFQESCQQLSLNLDLGEMDTSKDFFRIIINGRRAAGGTADNMNNISIVLEMDSVNNLT